MVSIKHEQEEEAAIESLTIESVLDLVEKDQKKVEFLLSDLKLQKSSLLKTMEANQAIIDNAEKVDQKDDDPVVTERLIENWIEVVDLLDAKSGMLGNAMKARNKDDEDFKEKLLKFFTFAPVNDYGMDWELDYSTTSLPIEDMFRAVCSRRTSNEELTRTFLGWIDRANLLVANSVKSMVVDHFSELGRPCSLRGNIRGRGENPGGRERRVPRPKRSSLQRAGDA